MKGAKLPTPARKIVPYGDWQFAASFYEIFPAPCLSAGAALEKSAFPTYRFFLIWLIALFLPSAHAADGARILFFPGGSKFRRGKVLLRKMLARRTCGAGKERLSHLQIFLNLVNDALSPIRASGGWGPDLILPRRK